MLAHLRINEPVTGLAARLASGPSGSTLAGRDSLPLDDSHDFRSSALSFLRDQPYLVASRYKAFTCPQLPAETPDEDLTCRQRQNGLLPRVGCA